MKLFITLIGMVFAGILGYSFEPNLRHQLTGNIPGEERQPEPVSIEVDEPVVSKIDPATFPVEQLPKQVTLKGEVQIADMESGILMTIIAGRKVDLVRLDGEKVVISPGTATLEGSIPISLTDLIEQLEAIRANPDLAKVNDEPEEVPEPEPKEMPEPEPEEMPEAEEIPEPEAKQMPAPEPVKIPESRMVPTRTGNVVSIMQASIRDKEINEFTFGQVTEWVENEEEEVIDGETYQTGIASYEGETVFGLKTLRAKALIKNGKLVRWVYEKSGMEIR